MKLWWVPSTKNLYLLYLAFQRMPYSKYLFPMDFWGNFNNFLSVNTPAKGAFCIIEFPKIMCSSLIQVCCYRRNNTAKVLSSKDFTGYCLILSLPLYLCTTMTSKRSLSLFFFSNFVCEELTNTISSFVLSFNIKYVLFFLPLCLNKTIHSNSSKRSYIILSFWEENRAQQW